MTSKNYVKKYTQRLDKKTVAISGSTGGLGRELCKLLAENGANIILIDRNKEKQDSLILSLKKDFPCVNVKGLIADMEDIDSVKALAQKLAAMSLFALILNAGAYSIPRRKTELGYDNVFIINFVSPYYLAKELLPCVKQNDGKIIAVGSIAHNYSKIDKNDVDFSRKTKASLVYGNAKRYLMYSFFSLAEQGEPVAVAHPGISFTGITAHYAKLVFAIIKYPMKLIFMKPRRACLSIYQGLFTTPKPYYWIGPRYFSIWGLPKLSKLNSDHEYERKFISETAEKIYKSIINQ